MKPVVLVLTSTYPRWADDVEPAFVHDLCRRLVCDYDVHVVAPHFEGAKLEDVMDGVKVHRFRYFCPGGKSLVFGGGILTNIKRDRLLLLSVPFFLFAQWMRALRLLRCHVVSVIHAHWVIPQGLVAFLLRLLPKLPPLVITSHGGDVYGLNGRLIGALKRRIYLSCTAVTAVSGAMADSLSAELPGVPVSVAPMGVDLAGEFVQSSPVENRENLIFVGRLVEKKGVDVLLRAVALLSSSNSELRLSIVGHGPYEASLRALTVELGLKDVVTFVGALPNREVPGVLNQHAIAVVPSVIAKNGDQEGLGLVTIEAMGCGCAVIASDLPAIRDVVSHGENGLLFPPGNDLALASEIQTLLNNESLRLSLARAAREKAVRRFDWEVCARRYLALFEAVIGGEVDRVDPS